MPASGQNETRGDQGLHFTIGAHPARTADISNDLMLLKASLLYADRIKLYSIQATMLKMLEIASDIPFRQKLSVLERVAPFMTSSIKAQELSEGIQVFRRLTSKKGRSPKIILQTREIERTIESQWEDVKSTAQAISTSAGMEQLDRAIDAGVVEVHSFEGTDNPNVAIEFIIDCIASASDHLAGKHRRDAMSERDDKIIQEFVRGLSSAVSDGSTFPIFDKQIGAIIREEIVEQRLPVSGTDIRRGRHSGLAVELLKRLPLFEEASIEEVLDIRSELERPLVRFRSAILKFSEQIRSSSWDEDFSHDAEMIFIKDVKPAILDIEDAVKSNRLLSEMARQFVKHPLTLPAGSILSLAISSTSNLPEEIAASLGVGGATAALIINTYSKWKDKQRAIEGNSLYFYYGAQERMDR